MEALIRRVLGALQKLEQAKKQRRDLLKKALARLEEIGLGEVLSIENGNLAAIASFLTTNRNTQYLLDEEGFWAQDWWEEKGWFDEKAAISPEDFFKTLAKKHEGIAKHEDSINRVLEAISRA